MLTPTERQEIIDEVEAGTFDLDDALDDIATEQKGEGVRRALYGGILTVNHEGHAGVVDPRARQMLDLTKDSLEKQVYAIDQQMAQFIENNSGGGASTLRQEDVLYTNGGSYASQFTLNNDPTEYDYVEITYSMNGHLVTEKLRGSQCEGQHAGPSMSDVPSGTGIAMNVVEATISFSGTTVNVNFNRWNWSGASGASATHPSSFDTSYRVSRVVGIKYVAVNNTEKDSELTDIRVGHDGTAYDSAGLAVRTQIQDLADKFAYLLLAIRNQFDVDVDIETIETALTTILDNTLNARIVVEDKYSNDIEIAGGGFITGESTYIDCTKAGYSPLGVVGIYVGPATESGGNNSRCFAYGFRMLTTTTASFNIRNTGSAVARVRVRASILYLKN